MDDRTRESAIEVVSIRWERIQLLLEVRPAAGTELDPAGLLLRQVGGRGTLPPTRASRDGDAR